MTKGQPASVSLDASLTVHAPAKVNLILRILDRRPDGFHNLWSVMHTVGLEDTVSMRVISSPRGVRLSCDAPGLSVDHSNLVSKAASAVLEHAQLSVGIELELRKRIPMGAGLGGGSSDAAATILGLNRLLNVGWSTAKMAEVGQALGSDVAFFLFAPAAIVSGRGEHVKPITIDGRRWIVLVKPAFGIETKWAYQELAATRSAVQPLSAEHEMFERIDLITWGHLVAASENDFETPIFTRYPVLREIKHSLLKGGAQWALLSGSGSTVFGVFEEESTARRAGNDLAGDRDLKVFVVPTY